MKKTFFTPWGLVFLSALFLCLGLGIRLFRYGDATALIGFGCFSGSLCLAQENRGVLPHLALVFPSGGYDGQFYYYLAAELGGGGPARLDDPILRKSRIAFPAFLSVFFYFGKAKLLLWAIIVSPILLHLFSVHRTLDFIRKQAFLPKNTISANLSLLTLALNPFVLLSASLGLADAWASAFSLIALLVFARAALENHINYKKKARQLLSALLLSFAFLSKETSLAFWPLFLSLVWNEAFLQTKQTPSVRKAPYHLKNIRFFSATQKIWYLCLALFPVAALLGWWKKIGFVPWQTAGRHAGVPFSGILWFFRNLDALFSGRTFLVFLFLLSLLLFCAWGLWARQNRSSYRAGLLGLLFSNLFLLVFSTQEYWMNFANIARLFVPISYLPVFALLGTLVEKRGEGSSSFWGHSKQSRIETLLLACFSAILLGLSGILIRDALYGRPLDFVIWP